MAVLVPEIQPGCHHWVLPATIRHGPIPPSILSPFGARTHIADPQGTARGIGLLISSSENFIWA